MPRKKAVNAKKKSPAKPIQLAIHLGPLTASPAQILRLKKALKNQVVTWVESDTQGLTVPEIVCEEFRRPRIRSSR
jgi:hypothetical protein